MKILFYYTSLSCKFTIDAATILTKYKKINCAFLIKKKKNISKCEKDNFIYLEKKIKMSNIYFFEEESKNKKIDFNYLNNFEKNKSIFNIWKMISSDRNYGSSYITDVIFYKYFYTSRNANCVLLNFITMAKSIEKVFNRYKPDVVYIPNGLSGLDVTLIESFSKYFKAKVLNPNPYRFRNYFYFSDNLNNFKNLNIKKNYFKTKKKYKENKKINQILRETIDKKNPVSIDAAETKKILFKSKEKNFFKLMLGNIMYPIIKHSYLGLIFFLGFRSYNLKYLSEYDFLNKIKIEIQTSKVFRYLSNLKSTNLNKKYIYYPLHLNPEATTLLEGNDYMKQEYLIETISKKIPSNYKLYVKEHPAQMQSHPRKISFYETIRKIPNVELININEDSRKLIANAQLVININGSSAFEGLITGIPTVAIKPYIYDFLNFSVTNININDLYFDIKKALKIKKNTSKEKLKLSLKILLESITENGFTLRNPDIFYYFKKDSSLEEQKNCSEDLAFAIIKELKLKKNYLFFKKNTLSANFSTSF
jgi:hypothetical protein